MIAVFRGKVRASLASLAVCFCALSGLASLSNLTSAADTVTLKNGLPLEGSFAPIATIAGDPLAPAGPTGLKRIVVGDDKLRRIFVGTNQIGSEFAPSKGPVPEKFLLKQRESSEGRGVASVGTILRVTPFDEYGRRIFTMSTPDGPANIVQGITEITPTYTRVTALQGSGSYVWQMSIATNSIPSDTLSKILRKYTDPTKSEDRLKIVRLYIQSERIQDARTELDGVIKDFPGLAALVPVQKELTQMAAQRLIKEIELRRDAGQPLLAIAMLEKFPSEGVAGETLLQVRDMLDEFKQIQLQGQQIIQSLDQQLALVKDERLRTDLAPQLAEIKTELNVHNINRLADYIQRMNDAQLEPEQKISLAISGWLLSRDAGLDSLDLSRSLFDVRKLVLEYLRSKRQPERDALLERLASYEGATPENLARLIAYMRPPLEPRPEAVAVPDAGDVNEALGPPKGAGKNAELLEAEGEEEAEPGAEESTPEATTILGATSIPGLFELTVAGLAEDPVIKYWVQLPPEYSPYRRYPCIFTLNGGNTTPQQQIDWWAGDYNEAAKTRYGQASRHGYVVISPQWLREHQRQYEFSAREHAAVLRPLRDACKRFSIDTDKVFLSGHSLGGDAVWDIGLSHPDLWAGVIPIVATADKHVTRYWENAKYVPFYFVSGDKDGDKLARNAQDWNRYLTTTGCDTMIVQYQGRGHEHFHDEILNLFKWMNLHQRNFFPKEIDVTTMRPWDSFFWWVDLEGIPENLTILPAEWPKSGVRAGTYKAKVTTTNRLIVDAKARKVTAWVSPELVNFAEKVSATINDRDFRNIAPSTNVLLEDVRSRGDRQHPFWAKVEVP